MKNIFLFIRRFFTFFTFLILQVLCISFLVKYNKSYEAAYSNAAHNFTGKIDKKYNNIQYYFDLKKTNQALADENAKLRNALSTFTHSADSLNEDKLYTMVDTLNKDTLGNVRKYEYYAAKVVNNSLTSDNNYITIEKGAKDGIEKDMAVMGTNGIVGHVVSVSPNYSIVMSLLNHNSRVSAMLKNSNVPGIVEWGGKRVNVLQLNNIPKSAKLKRGDTVLTSNLSGNFPEGLMVGRVLDIQSKDAASNFYNITVSSSTNFYTLQYVYVIKNKFLQEQRNLETTAPK
ncbi:MAG TPA: rod shape-determining protein MreC [Arachidicoccus soli]|nr:rod shape-determining protein MreC [Arachidicoccus soli]